MGEEFDDVPEGEELFNDDFDDKDTVLRAGVQRHVCPKCERSLDYKVEGRFVVRYCQKCGYEEED